MRSIMIAELDRAVQIVRDGHEVVPWRVLTPDTTTLVIMTRFDPTNAIGCGRAARAIGTRAALARKSESQKAKRLGVSVREVHLESVVQQVRTCVTSRAATTSATAPYPASLRCCAVGVGTGTSKQRPQKKIEGRESHGK